jgi:hypothetical protein
MTAHHRECPLSFRVLRPWFSHQIELASPHRNQTHLAEILVFKHVQSFPIEPIRVSVEDLRIAPVPPIPVEFREIPPRSALQETGSTCSGIVDFLKQVVGQSDGCLDFHKMIIP